jgi:hypothetical protein
MPLHREFVARLLEALRPQGYSIYAAETFSMFQPLDHQPVLGSDGWYSNEPIFGRTVQLARKLRYSLVAYEQTPEQAEKLAREQPSRSRDELREAGQAANLMKAIFATKPKAKVVIHVGHSHVRERKAPWSSKPLVEMAELLKQSTGQDPLTISQLDCRSATAQVVLAGLRKAGEVGSPVDLFIGHPAPVFRDGRPAWRQDMGDRAVEVPALLNSGGERIIVEARPAAAGLGTTPVDSVLLYPGERLPLLLPRGRYRVDGFVEGGRVDVAPVVVEVR